MSFSEAHSLSPSYLLATNKKGGLSRLYTIRINVLRAYSARYKHKVMRNANPSCRYLKKTDKRLCYIKNTQKIKGYVLG